MNGFSAEVFAGALALIGLVIVVSAWLSGFIERSGLPQVAVFLGLGAALGPAGIGVLNVSLDSPALRIVATLSLVLVLFTDAVSLDVADVRKRGVLAFRVLGPGTLLSAALLTLAGWAILGLHPAAAAILGAALASTDPVLLRNLLRSPTVPASARQALRLESGLNDVVLLPIVLVAMIFLSDEKTLGIFDWAKLFLDLFILGPGAGILVGLLAVATLDLVRRRIGVRRDYESLYSLGVAFTAFAAAEALHGSGFLAVFAAGMTISALDVELCDCFLEYGETTAEMALLFTFVIFGGSLIWNGFGILTGLIALFVIVAMLVRPFAFYFALLGAKLEQRSHFLISWFGPRGLSSLLLVLLPVFDNLQGSIQLFNICSLVVIFSVVIHGSAPIIASRRRAKAKIPAAHPSEGPVLATAPLVVKAPPETPDLAEPLPVEEAKPARRTFNLIPLATKPAPQKVEPPPADGAAAPIQDGASPADGAAEPQKPVKLPEIGHEMITVKQLQQLWQSGEQVVVVDVRTERTYNDSDARAVGSIRLHPEQAVRQAAAKKLPKEAWVVAYCT